MAILIVDDEAHVRKMVRVALRTAGFTQFLEASGGVEAMNQLPDATMVITDLKMPGMGGVTLVKEIRNHEEYDNIPIMVMTSDNVYETVHRLLALGVDDYVVKPFDNDVLVERVQAALEKRRSKLGPPSPTAPWREE